MKRSLLEQKMAIVGQLSLSIIVESVKDFIWAISNVHGPLRFDDIQL